MDLSPFAKLPDELIELIVLYLPPRDTGAFGETCKRGHRITFEPLVWRRHCVQTWKYWEHVHQLPDRLAQPPAQTRWRALFDQRQKIDQQAEKLFEAALLGEQYRIQRIESIAAHGCDVKDFLIRQRDETPDDAEDVLARRYFAAKTLGQIHRSIAIAKWTKVQKREMIRIEEVVGAYDLFVLGGSRGDLEDMEREFDRLADAVRTKTEGFENLTIRQKALQVARHLRAEGLVGNPREENYHALRNNFIGMALFEPPHSSLPLQSVVIYCAVARRLGLNAKPSNYPQHVHAVIEAPRDMSLDGRSRDNSSEEVDEPERMYMDPWRTTEEVPHRLLALRLSQMGAPEAQHAFFMGPSSSLEVAIRAGRNIMNSVQASRNRLLTPDVDDVLFSDMESAWYSMLWAMLILGDASPARTLHRRQSFLPYLIERYQQHFPEDVGFIERIIIPLFETEREHETLATLVTTARKADNMMPAPSPRIDISPQRSPQYLIGTLFRHARYSYTGVIVGWDVKCNAQESWIQQMGVDRQLSRGREQPFYNVMADDRSQRYVAEDNIIPIDTTPCNVLMSIAGQYFKRWDRDMHRFVSNMRDKYPDD